MDVGMAQGGACTTSATALLVRTVLFVLQSEASFAEGRSLASRSGVSMIIWLPHAHVRQRWEAYHGEHHSGEHQQTWCPLHATAEAVWPYRAVVGSDDTSSCAHLVGAAWPHHHGSALWAFEIADSLIRNTL